MHLSTSSEGGAGIAARRLHNGLKGLGIDSNFLSIYRKNSTYHPFEMAVVRSPNTRLISAVIAWFNSILSSRTYFTIVSSSPLKAKNLFRFGSPSEIIFHVHNWFNLIELNEIEKALDKGYKFVFTLHDQRLFTGGCHYSLDCIQFTSSCASCPLLPSVFKCMPSKNLNASKKILRKYRGQIEIIAPSQWIKTLAGTSSALKANSITWIPNWHGSFDQEMHSEGTNKYSQRKTVLIGIASTSKKSNIKGREIILSLESLIRKNNADIKIIYLADFKTKETQVNSFWGTIDYLLVPSIMDNSPNVIHEAKIFGVPVIATAVGGIGELLNRDYDHLVSLNVDTPNLIWSILKKLKTPISKEIKDKIKFDYTSNQSEILIQYSDIYKKLSAQVI